MEQLVMVGVAHGASPLEAVEHLAVRPEGLPGVLCRLRLAGAREAVVLSTCSRVEVYAIADPATVAALQAALVTTPAAEQVAARAGFATRTGRDAEAHLYRVAAGMASSVPGEVEIQGQVRAAARAAADHGSFGPQLRAVFGGAIATARRAHRTTELGALGRSVGRSGIDAALAGPVPEGVEVAVVGTGRMAGVACRRLAELGVVPTVLARSVERAGRLVGDRPPLPIDALPEVLRSADVVVFATSAAGHLVTAGEVRSAMARRRGRALTVVDLSVPRNVDAAAAAVPGVRLVDMDGVRAGEQRPAHAALADTLAAAGSVVDDGLRRLEASRCDRMAGAVIADLQHRAEEACRRSLRRLRPELVVEGTLDRVARSVSRRLVHHAIVDVRAAARADDLEAAERIAADFVADDVAIAEALDTNGSTPTLIGA